MQNNTRVGSGAALGGHPAVLITGVNGFVGQCLSTVALQRGWRVTGAVRTASTCPAGVEPVVVGDIDDETKWAEALRGIDIVVHLAARVHVMKDNAADPLHEFRRVNLHGTTNLARQAARAGVKRLVYVSSIKVNGEETQGLRQYSDLDTPAPQDPYAISKWEAEQALHRIAHETGLEVVILRPPLMYGPGVKGNFASMLRVLGKSIPLPLASVDNRRSLLYVGNFVSAITASAIHPVAADQTYLVSDGEDISTPDLLRRVATALGVSPRLFPFPRALLRLAGKLSGKSEQIGRLLGSLRVDSDKIRRDLNWQPPYSLQQGLQATADWYRNTRP